VTADALRGLARNPAAPNDVLLALLAKHPRAVTNAFRCRTDLPPKVLSAMVEHPDADVRAALAYNHSVEPRLRLRLAADPAANVRYGLETGPELPLPDTFYRLNLDAIVVHWDRGLLTEAEVENEVPGTWRNARAQLRVAAGHPHPLIRNAAARVEAWASAPRVPDRATGWQDLERLSWRSRSLLSTTPIPAPVLDEVLAKGSPGHLTELARNPDLEPGMVARLVAHTEPTVRAGVASRDDLTSDQLEALLGDPDRMVRTQASVHPALTEEQRTGVDIDLSPQGEWAMHGMTYQSMVPVGDPRSVNVLLRRRAAEDPHLPAEEVRRLSQDRDPEVRFLVAWHQRDVPPNALLTAYIDNPTRRTRFLTERPDFPTTDLARFATHPHPGVRLLATLDPQAPAQVIATLLEDPDWDVSSAAASCPLLPAHRIVDALHRIGLGESAGANPALPPDAMRDLIR
jgi:hypothetical protein